MQTETTSQDSLVDSLIARGIERIEQGRPQEALDLAIQAKSLRHPRPGIDMLRGVAFLRLGRDSEAREALREELRIHPANRDAGAILEGLGADRSLSIRGLGDSEFQEILGKVRPYSMLSEERLLSLFEAARRACMEDRPGNFVECGVAAGGSSALLSWVVKRHSRRPRKVFSLDTFEGMPPPTSEDHHEGLAADATGWGTSTCAAPMESLLGICRTLGTLDVVVPVKGLFQDTLPVHRDGIGSIALLHMDGDWYDSTMAILRNLYDQVVPGGFVQIDDYGHWAGCRKAFHEFESTRGVSHTLASIDSTGVWFRMPAAPLPAPASAAESGLRGGVVLDTECAAGIAEDVSIDLSGSLPSARLVVSDGAWIGYRCSIRLRHSIRIGSGTVVEPGVLLADFDPYSPPPERHGTGREASKSGLVIGSRCRIGAGACLVGPLAIGDGAVILPGSFVDSDVPALTKVGGIPARMLCRLDSIDGNRQEPLRDEGWMTGKGFDHADH